MDRQATIIQRWYRKNYSRRKRLRCELDEFLKKDVSTCTGVDIFKNGLILQSIYSNGLDQSRFRQLCCIVLASMESSAVKTWYVSVALNQEYSVQWIRQTKWILVMATKRLKGLKPGLPKDDQLIQTFLSTFVLLSDSTLWKLSSKGGDALKPTLHKLCSSFANHLIDNDLFLSLRDLLLNGVSHPRIKLDKHALPAAMGIRVMAICGFSEKCLQLFLSHILTVPAVILHLRERSSEAFNNLQKFDIATRCLTVLKKDLAVIIKESDNTEILALMGNMMQLMTLQTLGQQESYEFMNVLMQLILTLKQDKSNVISVTTTWHLMFGWIDHISDKRLLDCLPHLRIQLQVLWNSSWICSLFAPVLALEWNTAVESKSKSTAFKKLFSSSAVRMSDQDMNKTFTAAHFYCECLKALPQLANDILMGLSANEQIPCKLWCFLSTVARIDLKRVSQDMQTSSHTVPVLILMCHTSRYLLSVLDDHELYEQQQCFPIEELQKLTLFLNSFVYACVWDENISANSIPVVQACLSCLILLLQRNQRKEYLPIDSLLIKNLKITKFLSEWKSSSGRAQRLLQEIPHVIPHSKRVEIFYEYIKTDKRSLGISSGHGHTPATYITIHRSRLLEDGYMQLCALSTANIKGVIRVKFINEQGLDEAGIDEMGVFKEFLEEIIKQAFDPSLGLFKTNSNGCLYPSHTSECHENHLGILEFLGKMLGKAVYEGIVVDLPFSTFFLHHLMKQPHSVFYSSLDELNSLDPELSKSLHFIKHYDGDMTDLCLTFSYEENFLGKVITHELMPGGSGIAVTSENKINYVHKLAHYKMSTQIKEQTAAFTKGFHSVIDPQWMSIFNAHEFQRVISGDDSDINIDELRKCTQYYGGYHDKSRVISWLWDILKNDFSPAERSAFLKFVTSCSHQPLLGFSSLDPKFSIRRVDTSSEEEAVHVTGVIKTLFGIKTYKGRLPTASTCFNLLKLPDYNKKSVLRDKLMFAISANAGFELS